MNVFLSLVLPSMLSVLTPEGRTHKSQIIPYKFVVYQSLWYVAENWSMIMNLGNAIGKNK